MKRLLKKLIPAPILLLYHWFVAVLAAVIYLFPSRRLIVIGVTGTNGKSTVVNLIARILEAAGHRVGLASTVNFKIAEHEWLNDQKMTMLGRFKLQSLLRQMVRAKCRYAVIETTSEGLKQYRHWGIAYDVAVFTNLTPEHIEAHGSFEQYKRAKGLLFDSLDDGWKNDIKKVSVVNLDDPSADYFLSFPADEYCGFTVKQTEASLKVDRLVRGTNITDYPGGVNVIIDGLEFRLKLLGRFNALNALAAVAVGYTQDLPLKTMKQALEKIAGIPGRMQLIDEGQPFRVIIDYAHEPAGLEQVYLALRSFRSRRVISVLGAAGGGRDRKKRPRLGELAGKYADYAIITNEDPYDDDPMEIIEGIAAGLKTVPGKTEGQNFFKTLDREQAIRKAFELAGTGDIVVITGKGSEQHMVIRGGKKLPWSDEQVARTLLRKHLRQQ